MLRKKGFYFWLPIRYSGNFTCCIFMHHQPKAESFSYAKKVNKKTPNPKNSHRFFTSALLFCYLFSSHFPDFILTHATHPFQVPSLEALSYFISLQLNRSVPPVSRLIKSRDRSSSNSFVLVSPVFHKSKMRDWENE
jgi:hypothetical protein